MSYFGGKYDVIVIGAGHAGSEAALASARMGMDTLLLTLNLDQIALMPCNPAIGGPAKSHIVREIDALGGEMGKNIDESAIQYRMLNTAKGPAVQALRAQADKKIYQDRMKWVLENQENLALKQAAVDGLHIDNGSVVGVTTRDDIFYKSDQLIITSGTYLRGRIVMGESNYSGGPNGQQAVKNLSDDLKEYGIKLMRFMTTTPARVNGLSLNYDKMAKQPGDDYPWQFSFYHQATRLPQHCCYLTFTNEQTHKVIADNINRSPLYSGQLTESGAGPRYCPSIEDKIVRFPDKDRHQLFVEPEGLKTQEYYIQGMFTSLPVDVQEQAMRTIPGLEQVEIMRPGYAIEYDCIDPTQLNQTLEHKEINGLFFAGQINGTSGYEEAAGQGLVAGINAVQKIKKEEPVVIKRSQGYVGVLIDDLVTKGTQEPYRMLTSRAEYRLLLRQDNADLRLTELGYQLGLINEGNYQKFTCKRDMITEEKERLRQIKLTPKPEVQQLMEENGSSPLKKPTTFYQIIKRPEISYRSLQDFDPERPEVYDEVIDQIEIQIKYEGYIEKQQEQVERFEKLENKRIPAGIDFETLSGISIEAKEKLQTFKPRSVGQASRISGIDPSDISVLMVYLERYRQSRGDDVSDGDE